MKEVEEEKETENEEEIKAGKRRAGQASMILGREGGGNVGRQKSRSHEQTDKQAGGR